MQGLGQLCECLTVGFLYHNSLFHNKLPSSLNVSGPGALALVFSYGEPNVGTNKKQKFFSKLFHGFVALTAGSSIKYPNSKLLLLGSLAQSPYSEKKTFVKSVVIINSKLLFSLKKQTKILTNYAIVILIRLLLQQSPIGLK